MKQYELSALPENEFGNAGGKAKGLALLSRYGLQTPKGYVLIDVNDDTIADASGLFDRLAGNVAVRSSSNAEDGTAFSAAGQYKTFLNVQSREACAAAIKECMKSLDSEQATQYSNYFNNGEIRKMSIVVQDMVDARAAGVLFTVNPQGGASEIILEAVAGLGEQLVSGMAEAEHYVIPYGESVYKGLEANTFGVITKQEAQKLCEDALAAAERTGHPLDMEWAIDKNGAIVWLQARPVTTEQAVEIDELDGEVLRDDLVFTTCNIGEMLPGAVTPLSLETTVAGIDTGLRRMLVRGGAYKSMKHIPPGSCVTSFSNHLFFNLTSIYKMGAAIAGASKEDVEASICGKQLDTPPMPFKKQNVFLRLIHAIGYFSYMFSRKKAMKKIVALNKTLDLGITDADNALAAFQKIEKALPYLDDSTSYHYVTSAHSGAMSSTVLRFIKETGASETDARARLAEALEDIPDIESVDILRSMRKIASAAKAKNPDAGRLTPEQLLACIESDTDALKESYMHFLTRHGHRSIREAELRSKSWSADKRSLMENILTVIRAPQIPEVQKPVKDYEQKLMAGQKGMMKKGILFIAKQARIGVYSREFTKAQYVKTVDIFKNAYIALGQRLVQEGLIPDADLLYFFRREELKRLIGQKDTALVKVAVKRRRLLAEQQEIRYNDVYIGRPEPISTEMDVAEAGAVLTGAPISRGVVKGSARIVKTVDDAKQLVEGEIMVAGFTDIGWSPYYSVIGGLVTEVGSALSHGAVVAREYGLPLVVNVKNATYSIKTGDRIELNATLGTVTILESL